MEAKQVNPETIDRLSNVVTGWKNEVTEAQVQLEQRIHEATLELSTLGGLLEERLRARRESDSTSETPETMEELRTEIARLKEELAERDARIESLTAELGRRDSGDSAAAAS